MEKRFRLHVGHRYFDEFVCPGCNVRIPSPKVVEK